MTNPKNTFLLQLDLNHLIQLEKEKSKTNEKVRENGVILKRLIDAVVYLSKEECSFREHDETSESDNKGNLKELIDFLKYMTKD
nr:unnamed protein product [Callosobruchus chinensis]